MKTLALKLSPRRARGVAQGVAAALSLGLTLGIGGSAFASGHQVNEHGTAAMGMGNAVAATIDDPSAIFHNPAGLASTEGTELSLGVTMISPHGSYEGAGNATLATASAGKVSANSQFIPVPNAFVSRALSSKAFVGFGFYAPYGLKVEWDDPNFVGRTVIETIELRTFFLTPTVALKLNDMFQVGAGVSLVPATVYLKRSLGALDNGQVLFPTSVYGSEGQVELSGSAFGIGATLGIQATFMEKLKVGLNYRSAVDLSFTGNADFQLPKNLPAEVAAKFPDGAVDTSLTLPHSFDLGVAWKDGPLTVEAGSQITLHQFDELRIDFARGLPTPTSVAPRKWTTAPLFKVGGQYVINDLKLRAGVGYDLSPVPVSTLDPTLPDADRLYVTVGAGYGFGPISVDLAYMALKTMDREVKAGESLTFVAGKYEGGLSHLIALSLGAKL